MKIIKSIGNAKQMDVGPQRSPKMKNSRGEHNHGPDGNEISKKLFVEKAKKAINKEPLKTIPCVNANKGNKAC